MILIGSRALKIRAPKLLQRNPLDFDFIATEDEYNKWIEINSDSINLKKIDKLADNKYVCHGDSICEFEIITPGSSSEILSDLVNDDPQTIETDQFGKIPCLDLLFTIKASHRFKKFDNSGYGQWWKNTIDYHVMKSVGAKIKPEYEKFFKLREHESYAKIKLPKLNVSKDEFFDASQNGVQQIFIHDDIHVAVANPNVPAYTLYMKDGSTVLTDNKKFFALPEEVRLRGVIEEALVLALERSLLPFPNVMTPDQAFKFALAKVASSITGGKFREYAHNNIFNAIKQYPKNYFDKFKECVKSGSVRFHEEYNGPREL